MPLDENDLSFRPFQIRIVGGENIEEEEDGRYHLRRYYCGLCKANFYTLPSAEIRDTTRSERILDRIGEAFYLHAISCPSITNGLSKIRVSVVASTVREPLTQQEIRREGIRCLKVRKR